MFDRFQLHLVPGHDVHAVGNARQGQREHRGAEREVDGVGGEAGHRAA